MMTAWLRERFSEVTAERITCQLTLFFFENVHYHDGYCHPDKTFLKKRLNVCLQDADTKIEATNRPEAKREERGGEQA